MSVFAFLLSSADGDVVWEVVDVPAAFAVAGVFVVVDVEAVFGKAGT